MPSWDRVIQPSVNSVARGDSSLRRAAGRTGISTISCRWEIAFIGAALLVVCGHLLIKAGLNLTAPAVAGAALSIKLKHIVLQPLVLLGLGVYGVGTLFWMTAVAQADISLLYPLTSLNYILIALFSSFLFQESISFRRGSGIAIISIGVVLLTRSQRKQKQQT